VQRDTHNTLFITTGDRLLSGPRNGKLFVVDFPNLLVSAAALEMQMETLEQVAKRCRNYKHPVCLLNVLLFMVVVVGHQVVFSAVDNLRQLLLLYYCDLRTLHNNGTTRHAVFIFLTSRCFRMHCKCGMLGPATGIKVIKRLV
jgi:hypothetical protein